MTPAVDSRCPRHENWRVLRGRVGKGERGSKSSRGEGGLFRRHDKHMYTFVLNIDKINFALERLLSTASVPVTTAAALFPSYLLRVFCCELELPPERLLSTANVPVTTAAALFPSYLLRVFCCELELPPERLLSTANVPVTTAAALSILPIA